MAEQDLEPPEGWELTPGKPHALTRRFTFGSYRQTRAFLDELANVTERMEYHPNVSFGTSYVNITIDAIDGRTIGETELAFAGETNAVYERLA